MTKHARLMISVWPKFYPGTENFEAMHQRGFLYERDLQEKIRDWVGFPYTFYDAFNPEARKLFWSQIDRELFSKHVDAWWLDATEPDLTRVPTLAGQQDYMNPTALGPGSRVLNAFPLENAEAVYNGQRAAAPDQRVFILTRSGFAGQQRYAARSGRVTPLRLGRRCATGSGGAQLFACRACRIGPWILRLCGFHRGMRRRRAWTPLASRSTERRRRPMSRTGAS